MKNTKKKTASRFNLSRLSAIMLVALMVMSVLASCTKSPDPEETDNPTATTDSSLNSATLGETEVETVFNAQNMLPEKSFNNDTLTFYARDYSGVWCADILSYGIEGEAINDAIYKRTTTIEDLYDVNLAMISSGKQSFYQDVITQINGGGAEFDSLLTGIRDAAYLVNNGVLLNLNKLPNLSLDKYYWSPFLSEQLSISNKLYYATGEISAVDNMSVRCFFFNKTMASDYGMGSLYDLVANNEWTYEKMFELCEAASNDGGDGLYDLDGAGDTFGIVAQAQVGFVLFMASGERVIGKNTSDVPFIEIGSTRSHEIADYLKRNINGNPAIQTTSDSKVIGTFTKGTVLFMPEVLQHAGTMRTSQSYDIDFGILPMPKYNKEAEYVQYSDAYCPNVYSIPSTNTSRIDITTFILEALAIESVTTLTPAYYETCLQGRYSTDEESASMIDIILSNYTIDLCDVYLDQWGSFRSAIQSTFTGNTTLTVILQSTSKRVTQLINDTVLKINQLP